jgi:hypothetical protein
MAGRGRDGPGHGQGSSIAGDCKPLVGGDELVVTRFYSTENTPKRTFLARRN